MVKNTCFQTNSLSNLWINFALLPCFKYVAFRSAASSSYSSTSVLFDPYFGLSLFMSD